MGLVSRLNSISTRRRCCPRNAGGFTLIELMIVVALLAGISTIAFASYTKVMAKTYRASAATCLVQVAQQMERFYAINMTYAGAGDPAAASCAAPLANSYRFALIRGVPTTYRVTAVPLPDQAARDPECGSLWLSHTGERGVTGDAPSGQCW